HMAARAPRLLPRRRGHRLVPARRGRRIDLQRALREQARHDGDAVRLPRRRRKLRQRRILLLIDVSGSMKARTDAHLRFAHALARAADRIEIFTMGTRLTRVTRAMRLRMRTQALAEASQTVADWDGGTRLGDALAAFLGVPRFAAAARGALVLVLSDGLERGDPSVLVDAVRRLSRLAWRIAWLSPLVTAGEAPQTEAMRAVRPMLHDLVPGGTTAALVAHILHERREAA
ncbi:VWA domain-containing protein, partial [Acidisphaera rubrifaciens]|uniref:VWA domain-containing protein n=1 Tax=Acidisphaera rubrifaciens TaxID=50715 RepID=UPI000662526F